MKKHTLDAPKLKTVFWGLFLIIFSACSPQLHKSSGYELIAVDNSIAADQGFEQIIAPYKVKLDEEMNAVIATSDRELPKGGRGETALGNLVADLQREFSEEQFNRQIDISVVNNGGLRNSLPQGNITVGNIFELAPFENFIYILELNADDVVRLGEYAVSGKNLGIAGMQIEGKDNKLTHLSINGEELDTKRTYLLAINDYLANGGDRMDFLINLPRAEESTVLMREMLLTKMRELTAEGKTVNASIEGRQNYQ
jgi:2',3'-cyclic-nucleotide 2'-phosphodiesterase (5'-nucleotidase family)